MIETAGDEGFTTLPPTLKLTTCEGCANPNSTRVFNLPCCFLGRRGAGVITKAVICKVPSMHDRQNKTVRQIARLTSLSRNTVCKYFRAAPRRSSHSRSRAVFCRHECPLTNA